MFTIIFYVMLGFFQLYVLKRFLDIFFQKQKKIRRISKFLLLLFWMLKEMISFHFHKEWINMTLCIVMLLMMSIFFYEDKLWRKLFGVFLIISMAMVCEDIVWIVLNHFLIRLNYIFLGSIVSYFLLLILQVIFQKCLTIGKQVEVFHGSYFVMLLIPICSIIFTDLMIEGIFQSKYKQLIGIAMTMLINILTFYLYDMILKSYEEKSKNILLEKQVFMYEQQFKIIKESQDHLKSFKHDMKHHFIMIEAYAKKQKMAELFDYMHQAFDHTNIEKEYVSSGNEDMDCILNYMIGQAKRIGAEVEVKLASVEEKFMPGLDLNVLLSNLLENAVDALINADNKKLDIYIQMDKGILYISISNTYHEIKLCQGKLMSSKRNYKEQGIGLENVQKIVEKYNGKMNINYDGNMFQVDVLLMLEF